MFGLGGGNVINLGIAIRLQDHFTNKAGAIVGAMNAITGSVGNTQRELGRAYDSMRSFGYAAIAARAAITAGYRSAITAGAEYQDQMITLKAIAGPKQATAAMMGQLETLTKSLSTKLPFGRIELAEAMKELVKAGVDMKDIPNVLEAMANSAVAADEALGGKEGVAAKMIDMLNAWNMSSGQASRMGDILTMTANLSTTDFTSIYEAMRYSQSTFMAMKIPIEDALAMIGSIGSAGLKGTMGGTSLSNTLRFLAKGLVAPTTKQSWALSQLGLTRADLEDSKTGVIDIIKTVELLTERMRNMKPTDMKVVMESLFGERGSRIQPLIQKMMESEGKLGMTVKQFRDRLKSQESQGAAERIAKERMTSFTQKEKLFQAAWQNFKITIFDTIAPALTYLLDKLTVLVNGLSNFAKTGIGGFIVKVGAVLGPLLLVTGGINLLTSALGRFAMRFVSFGGILGKAGKLAWLKSIAHLLGYPAPARAGQSVTRFAGLKKFWDTLKLAATGGARYNVAGRPIANATGRFLTVLPARIGLVFAPLLQGLSKMIPILGWISAAFSAVGVSMRTQLRAAIQTLLMPMNQLANIIMEIISWFPGESSHDYWQTAKNIALDPWKMVTDDIRKANPQYYQQDRTSSTDAYSDKFVKNYFANRGSFSQGGDTVVVVNVAGEKVIEKSVSKMARNSANDQTLR